MNLGPIAFRDFEIPSGISFGGRQGLATYKLANGQRIVEVLGPESADIRLSGIFSGTDALRRAQGIDLLRSSGVRVPLAWGNISYTVIVSRFTAIYENAVWIPYRLVCTVVQDYLADRLASHDGLASSMLIAAAALIQTVPDIAGLAIGLGLSGDGLMNPTSASVSTSAIAQAQAGVNSSLAGYEIQFSQAALFQQQPSAAAVSALAEAESASQAMSALVFARSYLSAAEITSEIS